MITPLLHTVLEPVVSRHRTLRRLRWQALGLAMLAVGIAIAMSFDVHVPSPFALSLLLLVLILWVASRAVRSWNPDVTDVARRIEERHPELHALLVTAVEQKPDPQTGKFNFLQQRVIRQVAEESRNANWLDAVPGWHLWSLRGAGVRLVLATARPPLQSSGRGR